MGGNAPLVQGAAPTATGNVNIKGGIGTRTEIGKYTRFHFCGISGHLGSLSGDGCRMDAGFVADGQCQRRTRNLVPPFCLSLDASKAG